MAVPDVIEMPLESGGSLLVEVGPDGTGRDGLVPAGRADALATRAHVSFEKALDAVRPAADALVGKLSDLSARPDEICVMFGLKLSAEAGAFIAASGVEANFTVQLRWIRSP
jgi:NTP-dependent ternary system trypsin peptidase co-occuring protein